MVLSGDAFDSLSRNQSVVIHLQIGGDLMIIPRPPMIKGSETFAPVHSIVCLGHHQAGTCQAPTAATFHAFINRLRYLLCLNAGRG